MLAYVLSLITTIGAMYWMNHAQPALLYIVPYVLIASFGLAFLKGEVSDLLKFSLEEKVKEKEE